jgi:hypothetical protein
VPTSRPENRPPLAGNDRSAQLCALLQLDRSLATAHRKGRFISPPRLFKSSSRVEDRSAIVLLHRGTPSAASDVHTRVGTDRDEAFQAIPRSDTTVVATSTGSGQAGGLHVTLLRAGAQVAPATVDRVKQPLLHIAPTTSRPHEERACPSNRMTSKLRFGTR